jgi:hypothetical protein
VLDSLTSIFVVLLGEGWVDVLYIVASPHQYWNNAHPVFCSVLMISCILFGNFVLFNLFLGLISYTFDRTAEDETKAPAVTAPQSEAKKVSNDAEAEQDLNEQMEKDNADSKVVAQKYEDNSNGKIAKTENSEIVKSRSLGKTIKKRGKQSCEFIKGFSSS